MGDGIFQRVSQMETDVNRKNEIVCSFPSYSGKSRQVETGLGSLTAKLSRELHPLSSETRRALQRAVVVKIFIPARPDGVKFRVVPETNINYGREYISGAMEKEYARYTSCYRAVRSSLPSALTLF